MTLWPMQSTWASLLNTNRSTEKLSWAADHSVGISCLRNRGVFVNERGRARLPTEARMPGTLQAEIATPVEGLTICLLVRHRCPVTACTVEGTLTHSCAADEDASVGLALCNHAGGVHGDVGVSRVVVCRHTDVLDRGHVGVLGEVSLDFLLVLRAGAVGCKDDSVLWCHA